LTKPFDLEEIKRVVFEMKHNEMFDKFHDGNLDIERLNHGVITLVPKVPDALTIQKFRPMCLLNVIYKIILTKLLAERLGFIIADTQTAFIRNTYIMEGIVILHETIHEIHQKKMSGVLFKIDFENGI
jgi:hypothetical protein